MATIAFYLLFPREDLVNLQDKPMDDVEAKRILVLHQAMVDLANTGCPNQKLSTQRFAPKLYTLIANEASVDCSEALSEVAINPNADIGDAIDTVLRTKIASRLFEDRTSLRNDGELTLNTRIMCLNADTGETHAKCDPEDSALAGAPLAAFVVTYANLQTTPPHTRTMPMLPYMLGKAFDFHYTGEPVVIHPEGAAVGSEPAEGEEEVSGTRTKTTVRLNTYCGLVDDHKTSEYPRHLQTVNAIPFVARGGTVVADITNTRYHIATLPSALNIGSSDGHWVVCVTPLNEFDGTTLTTKIDY